MTTDRFPELHCDLCGCLMGEVSLDELEAAFPVGDGPWVCFDCSPDEADKVPGVFESLVNNNRIMLGDEWFVFWNNEFQRLNLLEYSRAHMSAGVRACLSSSTYLNTSPNQKREREQDTGNNAICPKCSKGEEVQFLELGQCEKCGWEIPVPACLILPSWVVKQPERATPCIDCEKERLNYSNRYGEQRLVFCAYHHALLIEQSEDGSLGWGHE